MAKYEGLDKSAKAEIEALKAKFMPDVQRNLQENKADVVEMLTLEILKRYYYQKGVIQYSLRDDKDLKIALKVLGNSELYDSILKIKK